MVIFVLSIPQFKMVQIIEHAMLQSVYRLLYRTEYIMKRRMNMGKTYNIEKRSDQRRLQRDMEKKMAAIEKKAVLSIQKKVENSIVGEEPLSGFYQRPKMGFPYSPSKSNLLYNTRPLRCPECFQVTGVKEGMNHCAWCGCQIEVDANTQFLE